MFRDNNKYDDNSLNINNDNASSQKFRQKITKSIKRNSVEKFKIWLQI